DGVESEIVDEARELRELRPAAERALEPGRKTATRLGGDRLGHATDSFDAAASACAKTSARRSMTSSTSTGRPSTCCMLATARPSMPHGTMSPKYARSVFTLSAKPCSD